MKNATLNDALLHDAPVQDASHLHQELNQALLRNPYLIGKQVRLEAAEDRVILRGHVASFFQKQMAQESLRTIHGVPRIENRLEVRQDH